jgi:ATP-dependent DNA ligase
MPAPTARAAPLPTAVAFQIASPAHEPPAGDGWLYEVKHDGHRLAVITDAGGGIRLLSRNGHERSRQFSPAFADVAQLGRRSCSTARSLFPTSAASPISMT